MERLAEYDTFAIDCKLVYYDHSFNCRGDFTLQSVKDLADSIAQVGRLLTPLWVQPACDVSGGVPDGYEYRLLAGHRRYRAITTFLKWPTIPATVFHGLTDRQARILNLTENLERKDLNPLEEALALRTLYPEGGTLREMAKELKRDVGWVQKRVWILGMPEQIQQMVAARRVTMLDLQLIRKRPTVESQIEAANAIAASKRGRGRKAVFTGQKYLRTFRRRRNKTEINEKIARMLNAGLTNHLAGVALAWCAGRVSDEELDAAIDKESENQTPPPLY
jgi:ParB/RepB/Spo0J family partition protein